MQVQNFAVFPSICIKKSLQQKFSPQKITTLEKYTVIQTSQVESGCCHQPHKRWCHCDRVTLITGLQCFSLNATSLVNCMQINWKTQTCLNFNESQLPENRKNYYPATKTSLLPLLTIIILAGTIVVVSRVTVTVFKTIIINYF